MQNTSPIQTLTDTSQSDEIYVASGQRGNPSRSELKAMSSANMSLRQKLKLSQT